MKRLSLKWSATLVCSAVMLLLSTSVGNAGLIPWVWNGLFGPHCPKQRCYPQPYDPCCAPPAYSPSPCGPGGCGIQSTYFAPSSCSPCSPCGPGLCGVGGCYSGCGPGGCPTGGCGISTPATTERTKEPPPERAKTYEDPDASTTEKGWEGTNGQGGPPEPGAEETKAFKPPPEKVPGRNGAAETPSIEDAGGAGEASGEESGESDNKGEAEQGSSDGPDLLKQYLDNASFSWRPATERKRLTRRATYGTARIVRRPKHAKGEWKAIPEPANVAKR